MARGQAAGCADGAGTQPAPEGSSMMQVLNYLVPMVIIGAAIAFGAWCQG